MFYEVMIDPASGGFGEYDQASPSGEGWSYADDLVDEIRNESAAVYELGVDDLPDEVDDIRGLIRGEEGRIFARVDRDGIVSYFAIVEA